ncbi:hypothetical protein CLU79DRAFT_829994 [Phycomyces nitens]|nr:hypothetical protein CLU79DRAFT_829994 [Phycomyces nitens]
MTSLDRREWKLRNSSSLGAGHWNMITSFEATESRSMEYTRIPDSWGGKESRTLEPMELILTSLDRRKWERRKLLKFGSWPLEHDHLGRVA